jgi:outer membrane protein TolC
MKIVIVACILADFSLQASGQATSSVTQTIDTAIVPARAQQNQFYRSVPSGEVTGSPLSLSLQDAIARGVKNNLGVLTLDTGARLSRADRIGALSALLPQVTAMISETAQQFNFAAFGFQIPGIPPVVGPFEYTQAQASASQSLFNWTAIKNHQTTIQNERAATLSLQDGRDVVVQVVAAEYFKIAADYARLEATRTQLSTAQTLYEHAREQHRAGTSPAIDEFRAQVQLKTRQSDLIARINQRDKDKLTLARVIGLPSGQTFELAETVPYVPMEGITLQNSLDLAYKTRADYQSALMQIRAAESAVSAAGGERYPTLQVDGSYGAVGRNPEHVHGTFIANASVRFNISDAGRSRADIDRANALLKNRKDQLADLQGQIDYDVRTALLDLQTASEQVAVAQENLNFSIETLSQAQTRFLAGVVDNIEVVQAQDSVAAANATLISAILAHNLMKVSLARAIGRTELTLIEFMKRKS